MPGSKVLSVIITGDVKGAVTSFAELDAVSGQTGDSIVGKFSKVGLLIAGGVAVGVAAAGVALFKIGDSFDEQYDKIRVGTGKTGDALKGLESDFKKVMQQVPTDFASAGDAITDLNARLGLTGPPLQDLAGQVITLSRITGTDLKENIASVTRLFGDWSIPTEKQAGTLDKLFRASQATGIGVSDLNRLMVQFGSPLRQLGLDFDFTAAMFARFEKEGVNTETVLPGLKMALKSFAEAGRDPARALQETIAKIKELGPGAEATQLAMDIFGQRAGPDLAAAIQEGRFELDGLIGTMNNGSDTIMGAAKDTEDLSEKWQMFKNKALVALEPVATRVFDALGVAMDKLPGVIAKVSAFAQEWWPKIYEPAKAGVDWLMTNVWPRLVEGFQFLKEQVQNFVAFFKERWDKIKEAVGNVVTYLKIVWGPALILIKNVWEHIGEIIRNAWDFIKGIVQAGVQTIKGIIDVVLGILTLDFDQAWTGIKEIISGVWEGIKAVIGLALDQIKVVLEIAWGTIKDLAGIAWGLVKDAIGAVWDAIKEAIGLVLDAIKNYISDQWDNIKETASTAWNAIKDTISGVWDGIKEVASAGVDAVVDFFRGLPGRVGEFVGDMLGAGRSLGEAVINGLKEGLTSVAGFGEDVASSILSAFKSGWNVAANKINDFIPDKISIPVLPDIDLPDNPIPTFHSGIDRVPGPPGSEMLAILQAGERVIPASQNRPGAFGGAGDGSSLDGAAAALVQAAHALIRAAAASSGQMPRSELQRIARAS